jgi:hypothetical protein
MSSFPSFRSTSLSLLALLSLVVVAPACTGSADESDAEDYESDLRIKPKDGETLSRLTIATPGGWTLPVNPADDATASYRSANVPLNVEQRLKDGEGDVMVASKFDVTLNGGKVTLVKGKATKYELASIKPTFDANTTLVRDFGPTPALNVFYAAQGNQEAQVYGQSRAQAAFWGGNPARAILAPPGAYRFSWSLPILDDKSQNIGAGANETVALTPPERRATIVVKKPAARELPDIPTPQCHLPTQTFVVHRRVANDAGQYGEPASYDQRNTSFNANQAIIGGYTHYANAYDQATSWAALPMKADTTLKVFPFAASEGTNHYEVVVSNVAMPLSLKPGDTKTIQLERLDVDDVEVTKETGEVYNVKGNWELYREGPNASWVPVTFRADCSNSAGTQISFPTGTGLDVLPGKYRLVIRYTTGEGPKQQDITVSVP